MSIPEIIGTFAAVVGLITAYYTREVWSRFLRLGRTLWQATQLYWFAILCIIPISAVLLLHKKLQFEARFTVVVIVALLLLACVFWLLHERKRRILYCKDDRNRWECIKEITYGHIAYEPFLVRGANSSPTGFGRQLLEKLLDARPDGQPIKLSEEGKWRNWDEILKGLVKDQYSIVATPLFATFDRSREVRFTAPIFFSNIGLYMRQDVASSHGWNDLTVNGMVAALEKTPSVQLLYVKGEISEKLANKYGEPESIASQVVSDVLLTLFQKIEESKDQHYAIFCESYYAENYNLSRRQHGRSDIQNVLGMHQILYPVCFAVRIGDYQLANLVNFKLLDYTQKGGAIDLLSEMLVSDSKNNHLAADAIKKHFVNKWPWSATATQDGADNHA